jgi:hypothetical protein
VYLCGGYLRVRADGLRDPSNVDSLAGTGDTAREEAEMLTAVGPSPAMTASHAERLLDFTKTDDWFDGQLRRLTFTTSRALTDVVLDLDLPNASKPAEREARSYRFRNVKDLTVALNTAELDRQRVRAGHITQGRMNLERIDDQGVDPGQIAPLDLSVYTTGGFIRISAKAVEPCGA